MTPKLSFIMDKTQNVAFNFFSFIYFYPDNTFKANHNKI